MLFLCAAARAEKIRVGLSLQPISAAVFAAQDLDLFKQAGVEVELIEFSIGKEALARMLAGQLDFAVVAETPLVHACLAGNDYAIVATVGQSTTALALVGRKDREADSFARMRGKRVGLTRGTNAEFFFENFRVLNGLEPGSVQMIEVPPERLASSLEEGEVDAVCLWEPYLSALQSKFGASAYYFDGGGMYQWSWNLVTSHSFLAMRGGDVEKVLRALAEAGTRIARDRRTAAAVLEKRKLNIPSTRLREILGDYEFAPKLAQGLILQMEAQWRWLAAGQERKMPNFLRYLDAGPLKRIFPEAVTVIE